MKRSLIVLCVAALLATLPLASVAEARRHGKHGRPGWPNRMMSRGSCRRANPARRPLQGWQGWRGRRGWRDCQDTQPEEVMVEIGHVVRVVVLGDGTPMAFVELMEVPESEVAAHLAHGDMIVGDGTLSGGILTLSDGTVLYNMDWFNVRVIFEGLYGDLGNADWYFYP
jgi:hypothetical protein